MSQSHLICWKWITFLSVLPKAFKWFEKGSSNFSRNNVLFRIIHTEHAGSSFLWKHFLIYLLFKTAEASEGAEGAEVAEGPCTALIRSECEHRQIEPESCHSDLINEYRANKVVSLSEHSVPPQPFKCMCKCQFCFEWSERSWRNMNSMSVCLQQQKGNIYLVWFYSDINWGFTQVLSIRHYWLLF